MNTLRTTLQVRDGAHNDATFTRDDVNNDSHLLRIQVTSTEISGSFTVNTCIVHYRHQEFLPWLDLFPWEQLIHRKAAQRKRQVSKSTAVRKSGLSPNFPPLEK